MKYITYKNGFEFTKEEVEETAYTLKNAIDGDVISAHFRKKNAGGGMSFICIGGKEWHGEKCSWFKPENARSLLELSSNGYYLKIIGHWRDGKNLDAFWNDVRDFTLLDLMTLNKFLLTNQK